MRIENVTKEALLNTTDLELKRLQFKFSKFWDRHFKNNDKDIVGCFKRSEFISKYRLLLKELDSPRRSLELSTCDIDKQAFKQAMKAKADGIDLAILQELPVIENQVIINEDFVKSDKVSVAIQAIDGESLIQCLEKHVAEIIKDQFGKECIFTYDNGLDCSGIPLFRQVFQPVTEVKKIEIKKDGEKIERGIEFVPIDKAKEDERIVCGIVYEPNTVDAQGDQASAEEIKKAAYYFMENTQAFKVMHKGSKVKVKILESYVAPINFKVGSREIKKGSWVLVSRILDDRLWKDIKAGKLTGYSMAGYAKIE